MVRMKIYCVSNGYIGNTEIEVLVLARDVASAYNLASNILKERAKGRYSKEYYEKLKIELYVDNINEEQVIVQLGD